MGCKYSVNGRDSLSLDKIMRFYYESKAPLVKSSIYSSEQDSVMSTIYTQAARKNEILELGGIALSTFISQQNEQLLKDLGLSKTRFAPAYEEESRILRHIKDKLIASGTPANVLEESTLSDIKLNSQYTEAIEYEKEILEIIEAEKKTNKLINSIKEAIELVVSQKGEANAANRLLAKAVEHAVEDKLIDEHQSKELEEKLQLILKSILNTIYNNGDPIVNVILTAENSPYKITSKLDIITVTGDGIANIYSIDSSKREFEH